MMRYLATTEGCGPACRNRWPPVTEFLMARSSTATLNLGIQKEAEEALKNFGIESLQQILDVEEEPGLGTAVYRWRPATWNRWPA